MQNTANTEWGSYFPFTKEKKMLFHQNQNALQEYFPVKYNLCTFSCPEQNFCQKKKGPPIGASPTREAENDSTAPPAQAPWDWEDSLTMYLLPFSWKIHVRLRKDEEDKPYVLQDGKTVSKSVQVQASAIPSPTSKFIHLRGLMIALTRQIFESNNIASTSVTCSFPPNI